MRNAEIMPSPRCRLCLVIASKVSTFFFAVTKTFPSSTFTCRGKRRVRLSAGFMRLWQELSWEGLLRWAICL